MISERNFRKSAVLFTMMSVVQATVRQWMSSPYMTNLAHVTQLSIRNFKDFLTLLTFCDVESNQIINAGDPRRKGNLIMPETLRVLFVDDDESWLNALRRTLRRSNPGWEVEFAADGYAALRLIEDNPFDVVVSDLNMPGLRGDSLLDQIAEAHPETLRFMLSGGDAAEAHGSGNHILAMEFINKDTTAQDLLFRIARGVTLRRFMRGRVVDRLADAVARLGDLPNMTMKIINPAHGSAEALPCIEISCPDLGLEFRTPIDTRSSGCRPVSV
ncbi:MAG: response regulator [Planctomycetaceae bacterium]|nr:response regulator [Planctomycetaceae bacterium]